MENIIIAIVLVCIVVAVIIYLFRARKQGDACIGCPFSKECSGKCSGNCQSKKQGKQ